LILPAWHRPNIGSRVLSLTECRVVADWPARFGHPLLLLETFAIDEAGHRTHIMSVVGHDSKSCHPPKKSAPCP
jgi:hypothetical protein